MRYKIALMLLISLAFIPAASWANPLVGLWQLDHERTIAEVNKIKDLPQSLRSFFLTYKDTFVYKFTEDKKYTIRNGKSVEQSYKILNTTENSISIKFLGGQMKNYELTYFFDKDAMYVLTSKYKVKQYYKKIADK